MNIKTSLVLLIISIILCGCPGILSFIGGLLILGFGILSNGPQLKLDTNLDRPSVLLTGASGLILGLIFILIPVVILFLNKRSKQERY
jgi:hypothetical protein